MIRFFYSLLLILISPIFLYSLYKTKQGKPNIGKRWVEHFGLTPPLTSENPVWIHAVSVGETIAITPVIRRMKSQYPEQTILLTTTTTTGAEQANKLVEEGLVEHRYMPLDFSFAVKRFIKTVNPQKLIIMETELWPNTLHHVAKAGIPIHVINARLSEKSRQNYQKVHALFNLMAKNITSVLCQYKEDAQRFIQLGIPSEKINVTGSVKYDISIPSHITYESEILRSSFNDRPVWIAASTHKGEDEILLSAHKALLESFPKLLLILVPRHPERFNDVEQLCKEQELTVHRRTNEMLITNDSQVYLGDTMGEMLTLIGSADICFMAGSLLGEKVGGHNMLEPAALGKPIITGPSYFNFMEITHQLLTANAISIINNEQDLVDTIKLWYSNIGILSQMGNSALHVVDENRGAIQKTVDYLCRDKST